MPIRAAPTDFESLVAAHLDSAYSLARWMVRDQALAQDVVQDAMLRAFKYFNGFRGENARAWLLQIVRNVAYTRLKEDTNPAASLDEALDVSAPQESGNLPEATLMREDNERLVQTLLTGLPVELRECLILRELEELSYKEISRVIGAPIGTVMSRLWRARKLLAEAAGALEGIP